MRANRNSDKENYLFSTQKWHRVFQENNWLSDAYKRPTQSRLMEINWSK